MAGNQQNTCTEPIGISAQELLRLGSQTKYGFIRKQGTIERTLAQTLPCNKCFKWRQRFVVLSQGCVYIYVDDYCDRPIRAFSCRHFKKCSRYHDDTMRHCFSVLPRQDDGKTLVFSCISDEHRKDWMLHFKQQIMTAQKAEVPRLDSINTTDYVYLEEEVRTMPVRDSRQQPNAPCEEDYTEIEEVTIQVPPSVKQPPTLDRPNTAKTNVTKARVASPPASRKPKASTSISRDKFEYHGSDRGEVERILLAKPAGTYLVRKSRNDQKEVLSVNLAGSLKEFKVYEKSGQVTIDHSDHFDNLLELIKYYTLHNLPKKTIKLTSPYMD